MAARRADDFDLLTTARSVAAALRGGVWTAGGLGNGSGGRLAGWSKLTFFLIHKIIYAGGHLRPPLLFRLPQLLRPPALIFFFEPHPR